MKNKVVAFIAFVLLGLTTAASGQGSKQKQNPSHSEDKVHLHRIVMQLSSGDTLEHKGLVNNLKNFKEGWGDSAIVEVVVHGPGIDLVTKGKSTSYEGIQQLIQQGIRFVVCRNTMKQKNISEDQIIPNVEFVPMGIGEVVLKQELGWSYLKAGF